MSDVIVIELWDRTIHECALCGEVKQCRHCVAYYCGPTYDPIGSVSTEYMSTDGKPAIVGGMVCCKQCHDKHEAGRLTTFRPDTSFPYLKIAREYGVDYGEVIRFVEAVSREQ